MFHIFWFVCLNLISNLMNGGVPSLQVDSLNEWIKLHLSKYLIWRVSSCFKSAFTAANYVVFRWYQEVKSKNYQTRLVV